MCQQNLCNQHFYANLIHFLISFNTKSLKDFPSAFSLCFWPPCILYRCSNAALTDTVPPFQAKHAITATKMLWVTLSNHSVIWWIYMWHFTQSCSYFPICGICWVPFLVWIFPTCQTWRERPEVPRCAHTKGISPVPGGEAQAGVLRAKALDDDLEREWGLFLREGYGKIPCTRRRMKRLSLLSLFIGLSNQMCWLAWRQVRWGLVA